MDVVRHNATALRTQLEGLVVSMRRMLQRHLQTADGQASLEHQPATVSIMNNGDYLDKLSMVDFLRVMGTSTRIGPMLGRDTQVAPCVACFVGTDASQGSRPLV